MLLDIPLSPTADEVYLSIASDQSLTREEAEDDPALLRAAWTNFVAPAGRFSKDRHLNSNRETINGAPELEAGNLYVKNIHVGIQYVRVGPSAPL